MLYAFDAQGVQRLRSLLIAYEQGRLRIDAPAAERQDGSRQDVVLGFITGTIPAGRTGTAKYIAADQSSPPALTQLSDLANVYTVLNPYSSDLLTGYYLLAREPSQGYYIPATIPAGGADTVQFVNTVPINNTPSGSLTNYDWTGAVASGNIGLITLSTSSIQFQFTGIYQLNVSLWAAVNTALAGKSIAAQLVLPGNQVSSSSVVPLDTVYPALNSPFTFYAANLTLAASYKVGSLPATATVQVLQNSGSIMQIGGILTVIYISSSGAGGSSGGSSSGSSLDIDCGTWT
jgi:hypothetical protein